MSMFRHQAIYNTHSNVVTVNEHRGAIDKDDNIVTLNETKVAEEEAKLEAEWKSKKYQRDRLAEFPSFQELVVALYDADDKAEIDKKRAEIKKKYPKP